MPASLGNLINLSYLHIQENQLSGDIPASLGGLANLRSLNLSGNSLTGSIPEGLGHLAYLQDVALSGNQLSGNLPDFSVFPQWFDLLMTGNCFDISPGSQVRTIIHKMVQARIYVEYQPQNLGCGPVALGDLNNDGSVDRGDLSSLMTAIRTRSKDLTFDLNGDGKVDIADARFLVMHFTNPDGSPSAP